MEVVSDTTIIRKAAGQSTGGQFVAHQRSDSEVALAENWPATPTAEQVARARESVLRQAQWADPSANIDTLDDEAVGRAAANIAELEGSLTAWKSGLPHQDDEAFEAIWDGSATGFGEAYVRSEIDHLRTLQTELGARRITPRSIIGGGIKSHFARGLAEEYLANGIADFELALECHGRNLSVNQANVRHRRREADKAALPF